MKKWEFGKKYLESAINRCKVSKKASSGIILEDIAFFQRCLNEDFSYQRPKTDDDSNKNYSFEEIKEQLLDYSLRIRRYLGSGFIDVLMKLHDNNVFNISCSSDKVLLDIDEREEAVLSTYERFMPEYYSSAERIILPKQSHIQLFDGKSISYPYYAKSLDEAYILLNKNDGVGELSFCVQDALELIFCLGYTFDFIDLGPNLVRLLFHDHLYDDKGIKYTEDYKEHIDNINKYLKELYPFLMFSRALASKKYNVSDSEFLNYCIEYLNVDKDHLEEYFKKNNISDLFYKVDYLIEALLAIEIRQKHMDDNRNFFGLNRSSFGDHSCDNNIAVNNKMLTYQKYVEDINNRCSK